MENKNTNEFLIGGKTMQQWEEEMQAPPISGSISYNDAEQMGLVSPEETQSNNQFYNTLDTFGIEHPDANKQYEKLGAWDTTKDVLASIGTEASHIFMPKSMELQYESRTKFGENMKYGYRYLIGTAGFMVGGWGVAGLKALANMGKIGKGIQIAGKILSGADLIKTGAKATKAAQIGARIGNASLSGAVAGALADFNLYRPEENEGHLADAFGDTNNAFISYMQSKDTDTDLNAKLKNVIEGFFIGIPVGNLIEFAGKPLLKRIIQNFKALKEGKKGAAEAVIQDKIHLDKFTKTADLVETVKKIREEAQVNNQDASQMLIDRLHPEDNIEAQKMLKVLDEGDEIFPHTDGTWDREVRTWDEAHKVSPEEFAKQMKARDEAARLYDPNVRDGDTAINYQDKAIRDTWVQRQWIDANAEFNFKNKQAVDKVVKNYQDKWNLKNKIEIEIHDGLLDKKTGLPIEGSTEPRKNIGTVNQNLQNKIDKQKLKIQKLEDKLTMAEGGNKEVTDPVDIIKEELRIAKNELKELNKTAKGTNKLKNIVIRLDKNAKNPYATLRAELEHARDIANGTVPKDANVEGSGTHFSRYVGDGEGEVASGYIYKKAQGKAKALKEIKHLNELEKYQPIPKEVLDDYEIKTYKDTDFGIHDPDMDNPNYEHYTIHNIVNKEGTILGHMRITKGNYIDWRVNTRIEKGAARKLIAKLLYEGKYKTLIWETTTPHSVTSYERFCREFPDLVDRIEYIDTYSKFDKQRASNYNQLQRGIYNDKTTHQLSEQQSISEEIGRNRTDDISEETTTHGRERKPLTDRSISTSNSPVNERGENTFNNIRVEQPQQLKLDFSQNLETKQTTEEVVTGIANGEVKPATKADIEAIVSKVEQQSPEINGFNWQEFLENPEKYRSQLEDIFSEEDMEGLILALSKGDISTIEEIVKKQFSAVKTMGELSNVIKNKGLELSDDAQVSLIDTIHHIADYIKGIKTQLGKGLYAQKELNDLLESYGATRLSSWVKEGIDTFSQSMVDALNDIINLNFTRGQKLTPLQIEQQLVDALLHTPETHEFMSFLIQNKDMAEAFTKEIEKIFKQNNTLSFEEGRKVLQRILYLPEYKAKVKAAQLAPTQKGRVKTILDWCDGQGGITSYYVHNLLSGIGSIAKNTVSGLINTVYFPAKKILAGIDPFIDAEAREALGKEGYRTYKCLIESWHESWALMKEAFINGNGKLTDIGENTLNMDNGKFKGFHELQTLENGQIDFQYYTKDPSKFWEGLQNFHSIMTRAMGATDEFMSQLNYRAIVRSKALQQAEKNAAKAGHIGDEAWIKDEADKIFQEQFDAHGKPLDVQALNEARTILYQNNLDGSMYNYKTGTKEPMRDPTFVMKVAGNIQSLANNNVFMKCMFPFVKTGANILQMALDHNGIYMALSPLQRKLLTAQTKEGALARSQVAFGMFSLALGSLLAFGGFITGSAPSDPKERKALFATGWRPYSVKFGDTYVSYQGYEPLHGMLGFAADCANMTSTLMNPEDEKRLKHFQEQVLPTLVNNFLDKAAFRTGLSQLDLIMNPQDNEEWARAMAQTAKGFLPNVSLVTNTKSVGKHDVLQPKTMYERVFYRYFPEAWTPMDYRRNVFGEKQSITGLLITSVGQQEGTPEEEALEYLARYGYTPSEIDDVISNTGLKISQFKDSETGRSALDAMKEEMSMLTIQGKTLREAVRDLVTSPEYQLLPDGVDLDTGARWGAKEDTKINAINSIFLIYKQKAKKNIIAEGMYYTNSAGQTMEEAKEDIQFKRLQQLNNLF